MQLADARSHLGSATGSGGASVQLQCKHLFHPLCIRGWTMVGEPARPAGIYPVFTSEGHRPSLRCLSCGARPATCASTCQLVRCVAHAGKKSVCPVCLEKVDLRHLWADRPWETRNISWCQALASASLHATVTGSKDAQPVLPADTAVCCAI